MLWSQTATCHEKTNLHKCAAWPDCDQRAHHANNEQLRKCPHKPYRSVIIITPDNFSNSIFVPLSVWLPTIWSTLKGVEGIHHHTTQPLDMLTYCVLHCSLLSTCRDAFSRRAIRQWLTIIHTIVMHYSHVQTHYYRFHGCRIHSKMHELQVPIESQVDITKCYRLIFFSLDI